MKEVAKLITAAVTRPFSAELERFAFVHGEERPRWSYEPIGRPDGRWCWFVYLTVEGRSERYQLVEFDR